VPVEWALLTTQTVSKQMDLRTLRAALGGEIIGGQLLCPGPGHSSRDRSLSITLSPSAPDGFLVFSHSGDDWRDCRDYVRSRLGLPEWQPGDEHDRRVGTERTSRFDIDALHREAAQKREFTQQERQRIARAIEIWKQGVDPRGTLAERYLNEERMLGLPDAIVGNVLRFHPRCPWRDENRGTTIGVPALVAAFHSIDNDEITAIHRIALTPDGKKRDRRMLGIVYRAAVKLDPLGKTVAVAEGIETAMAARELGVVPCWALGSVGAISQFPILDGVKTLTIVGEAGDASANAVELCKARWRAGGRSVRVVVPDPPHSDLNDELIHNKRKIAA
jgi:putative DNA primase/helicase